jgi:protein-disulfide isomerase
MKKSFFIFLRVIFIIGVMLVATFYGFKFYYQTQSDRGIEKSLVADNLPVIGQTDAPFTIVEFFDYRCSHCSAMSKLVDEAVRNDPHIKILLRPVVLSDDESLKISTLVLAADSQKQGATLSLHKDIMALPSVPTYDSVKALATSKGINIEQAEKDGESFKPIVAQNTSLVVDIGFYGVPALVIGDKGFMPQSEMPGVNELRLMIIDAKQRLGLK